MIGIIADDTTGANDIGIMFRKNGYSVKILTYEKEMKIDNNCDVLVIDTDSRLDPIELSYSKVYESTKLLKKLKCTMFYKKVCSVFRGNIGAEFDAMMDCLGINFAVISLAFPKNGRTTIHGIHTVNGLRLEDSNFANDPVHPMKESDLVSILSKETERKVVNIDIEAVRQGAEHLKKLIETAKAGSNYCIIDGETQEDLAIIAEATADMPFLGGSSAIGEELPKFMNKELVKNPLKDIDIDDKNGVLIVSGSLTPQTKAQTEHLKNIGIHSITVDSRNIFSKSHYDTSISNAVYEGAEILKSGYNLLVMADNNPKIIAETKQLGKNFNFDELKTSKMVSKMLSEITKELKETVNLKRLVVAGGDTSGTICRELDIKGMYVLEEIETGLPSGLAIGPEMLIVLKSGSFGKPDFLETSISHLKNL